MIREEAGFSDFTGAIWFISGWASSRKKGEEQATCGKAAGTFMVNQELVFMEFLGDTCKHSSA